MNNLKLFLICMIIFKTMSIPAQTAFYESPPEIGEFMRVIAKSGINFRSIPDVKGEIIDKIQQGDLVYALDYGPKATIENIEGFWFSSFYKGRQGFVFSGYLETTDLGDSIEFYFPEQGRTDEYSKSIYDNDPNSKWYGIFYGENENRNQVFKKEIPFKQTLEYDEGYQHKVADNFDFNPNILFKNIIFNKQHFQFQKHHDIIYPGETVYISIYSDQAQDHHNVYQVFATGEPYTSDNLISQATAFTGIRNYQLWVRLIRKDSANRSEWVILSQQLLYANDVIFNNELINYPPTLYSLGDFDEDGKLDAIFVKSEGKGACVYLCLSSKAMKGYIMRFCARTTISC